MFSHDARACRPMLKIKLRSMGSRMFLQLHQCHVLVQTYRHVTR